jgi:hypothetical protein
MTDIKQEPKGRIPSDIDLANYARAYVGAYLSAVQSEGSEHVPMFARNHPYSVEVCFMSNGCFCMLFEKAEKSTIVVASQTWDYVMGKVMSGISYLVTAYPHEGFKADDAVSKGKRDAIRDIRALESSDLVDSTRQLEKLLDDLKDVSQWNKSPVKMAESAMAKLEPLRQTILRTGPGVDMLSMVDSLRSYPPPTNQIVLDDKGLEIFQSVAKELKALGELVKKVETQDAMIGELERTLKADLKEFKVTLDKKMAKGLGVILATTDRKIDKAIGSASLSPPQPEGEEEEEEDDPRFEVLTDDVTALKEMLAQVQSSIPEPVAAPTEVGIPDEFLQTVGQLGTDLGTLNKRLKRIEDYLVALTKYKQSMR